jgi:hypothetical protein
MGRRAKDTYDRASSAVSDMRTRAEDMTERFRRRAGDESEGVENQASGMTDAATRDIKP